MADPEVAVPLAPSLTFSVREVTAPRHTVGPELVFTVQIDAGANVPIASISLQTQFRIAAGARRYGGDEKARLGGIFGHGEQWARSVKSLHWANVAAVVPAFVGETRAALHLPLTYDMDVASAHFLQAVDGEVTVELLFSGTIFHVNASGVLQTAMISWDTEAQCPLPLATWREAMDVHFPDTGWIRLSRATLARLQSRRAALAAPTWEAALDRLCEGNPSRE